jgi:hypothetical protein
VGAGREQAERTAAVVVWVLGSTAAAAAAHCMAVGEGTAAVAAAGTAVAAVLEVVGEQVERSLFCKKIQQSKNLS